MWNTSEVWYAYDTRGACYKKTATYEEMKEWLDFEIKLNDEECSRLDWLIKSTEHVDNVIFRPIMIGGKFGVNAYVDEKFDIYVNLDVPFDDIEWGNFNKTFEEFKDFAEKTFKVED